MNESSHRRFKNSLARRWDYPASKLLTLLVMVSLVVPPAASIFMAYSALVTRYVARHVVPSGAPEAELPFGQVVAVVGRIRAKPVQMPSAYPQFENALMIVERHEWYKHGRRSGWKTGSIHVWISDPATFAGWQLDSRLVQEAEFDWYRASPCTHYVPRAGWVADCDKGYAYREGDDDLRYSYEITPIPQETMTIVAAASGEKLTPIEHRLSAPPADFVLWTSGTPDVGSWLLQRLAGQMTWAVFWAAVTLAAIWWYMYAQLRREGGRTTWAAFAGGCWRALATTAPLAGVTWPFDGPGFIAVAFIGAFVSVIVGFALWLSVVKA